jgi:DNA polymerase III subunit epsilon
MRQIVLDTETTGLEVALGHRMVELGCVELDDRAMGVREFHQYLNPERASDEDAYRVHQLSDAFLRGQGKFHQIAQSFVEFVSGAELLIHNAPFDVGFVNAELRRAGDVLGRRFGKLEDFCVITDTLGLAKRRYPGQRNSLDALCKRLSIDNSSRTAHGALLDAKLLAEVYLAMTRGQNTLEFASAETPAMRARSLAAESFRGSVLSLLPSADDLVLHNERLAAVEKASKGNCVWLKLAAPG